MTKLPESPAVENVGKRLTQQARRALAVLVCSAVAAVVPTAPATAAENGVSDDVFTLHRRSASSFPLYGELLAGGSSIHIVDTDYYPLIASASFGLWLADGVGIEVFADGSFRDDEAAGFELDMPEARGLALRLESPPVHDLSGYITLGYVEYDIEMQSIEDGAPISEEEFGGVRVSVGFTQTLGFLPIAAASLEYRHYNADTDANVDAILFGFRLAHR
ncbi:MAG: hypothetical protein CSB44_00470 [Gammaproteobacteria bacterium]|nr:MAG: hypothetical protein CSB44_00470 [Gammaproteobacteria bacterium]